MHPLGMDGRRCLSVRSVCVCTHVCSPQLRAWVRVCLVPVDRGVWGCVCVCVCVHVRTPGEHHCETELFWLSFHSV